MARALVDTGDVELGIIALGPVERFTRRDYVHVRQWLMPGRTRLNRDGLPPASLTEEIVSAARTFSPDLVHSWGTEGFWGLLPARGLLRFPSLLEIQGLKGQIANAYYGGLSLRERLSCVGIRELLKRRTMSGERRAYARWAIHEQEIIRGHRFVAVQSPWVVSRVQAVAPEARLFRVDRPLRQPFYEVDGWRSPGRPTVYCSAAYTAPSKGLHVAVRALAVLRRRIPDVRLRIAGFHQRAGIRQGGYLRWVNRISRGLGVDDAIDWLGPLDAARVVSELRSAAAAVIPTYVETYCVAFAEAMRVGTPTVASYTGGTAHLGRDEHTALFFPPGDEAMCAYQLERLLTDQALATRLSREMQAVAKTRNDRGRVVRHQLEIYQQVLEDAKPSAPYPAVTASER